MFGTDISLVSLIVSLMIAATPILLAAIGELVVEKSGVLNLGVEGMMIVGAICGFMGAVVSGSPWVGFLTAALGGMALAFLFAILTQVLLANQVASGLALTLFGLGAAAFLGHSYTGLKPPSSPRLDLGQISDLPIIGPILFSHDFILYLGLAIVAAVWFFLTKTRGGLILRATGENHDAAHALGYKVVRVRIYAILFGGAMAGLGGGYLSLIRVPQWTEGMTAGAGWIALAIVVFAAWKPWRVILGAYLFGGVTVIQLNMQAAQISALWLGVLALWIFAAIASVQLLRNRGSEKYRKRAAVLWIATLALGIFTYLVPISIPVAYLSMTPYLVTIIVLVIMSADSKRASLNAPASLGKLFHASS